MPSVGCFLHWANPPCPLLPEQLSQRLGVLTLVAGLSLNVSMLGPEERTTAAIEDCGLVAQIRMYRIFCISFVFLIYIKEIINHTCL